MFNERLCKTYIRTPEDAERLGADIILPPADLQAETVWFATIAARRYDDHRAGNANASFENKAIPWDEREFVKRDMYAFSLGEPAP